MPTDNTSPSSTNKIQHTFPHFASFVQELEAIFQDGISHLRYIEFMDKRDFQANEGWPVLIVDDDGPTLELYARALQPLFRVSTSSNWQDAMAILFAQEIRIVVIEPSVAGYRVWELLEELIRVRGLLVVICSVLDDRRYGLAAGALAYLVKPVLPSTLLETLQSILG